MNIQSEKDSLIEYITQLQDEAILTSIKEFVQATEQDFWNDLTRSQQQEIKKGMEELDRGEKFDYEELMSKHR
jgi:predicted transcriptional regulator